MIVLNRTSSAATGAVATSAGRGARSQRFVPIEPGARYEWEIRLTVPTIDYELPTSSVQIA